MKIEAPSRPFAPAWFLLAGLLVSGSFALKAEKMSEITPVVRKPVVATPMIFPRIRTIYNLYRNNYQNFCDIDWLDRPLFHDSSLYKLPPEARELENNRRQFDIAMSYGVDGLSMLYHGPMHFKRFEALIDAAEANHRKNGNKVLISLLGHILKEGPEKAVEQFAPVLERMIASPCAARINGKVVVGSYRTDYISPEQLATFLKLLRERCGDKFYFIATIASLKGIKLSNYIHLARAFEAGNGKLPESEIEAAKNYLRAYLKVSDGLLMNGSNHVDTVDYGFDRRFYEEFICRIFSSVLSEPGNEHKLLGLSASLGYVNHIAGSCQLENGTRTLRDSLTAALTANPDFIIMPEWNELNENTCLDPGVLRSTTSKRIIRYFSGKARGDLSPLPGDRIDIPNLIVSSRAVMKGGDAYFLEVLNVPDTSESRKYTVSCTLKDENGSIVKSFPPHVFDASKLEEYRFTLTPRELAQMKSVKPELEIETTSGKKFAITRGLPAGRFQNTWNTNYTCWQQPLRDLAEWTELKTTFTPGCDGGAEFTLSAKSNSDRIRSAEILENDRVVYAYDHQSELVPGQGEALLHFYYSSTHEIKPFPITLSVSGGKIRAFRDRLRLGDAREEKWGSGQDLSINWKANQNRRGAVFIVDNHDSAVINIKSPVCDEKIKVSDLIKHGRHLIVGDKTVNIGIENATRAMDVPEPANLDKLSFSVQLTPQYETPVYQLRLTTMSGKSYMDGPWTFPQKKSGITRSIRVFDTDTLKGMTLDQDSSDCVELNYTAADANGAIIRSGRSSAWDATLGGGNEYGGAFSPPGSYPKNAEMTAPSIVSDGNEKVFEFDGKGNYLHFPAEALPSSSAFTLEFEFKPFSLDTQKLVTCYSQYETMLEISIMNKKIHAIMRGRLKPGETPYYRKTEVNSDIPLRSGEWNRVVLTYDLEHITLTVNGGKAMSVPWSRPSWWLFSPFSFGGHGKGEFFKGQLRNLKIKHRVE